MVDLDMRLKDMDAMGVDIQVISPSILHQCTYSLDPQEALLLERINNDHVAEIVARKPDRQIGLGCVPLQDAAIAASEMERCVKSLGLKGIIVGSRVNDWELGDEHLWPFWQKAEALGVPLFMHPAGNSDPRLRKHTLLISLGQPLEEAFAMCSLIYEGVMDKFPGLKIVFAHGGGFVPFYTGRFDWMYRRGANKQMKTDFSAYLKKFYYETVVFDPAMLEQLADKAGAGHIMLGSDYPFGEWKPIEFVRKAKRISEASRRNILGANAAKLLGLSI
jgi:aminocarboxymuconate-semialdehyde decarboxylase